jgi:acetylornithine/succinyldiaminopimelate/putrescine aminotransferase
VLAPKLFLNTFGGNPVCCAGGRAVLRVIDNEGIQANCAKVPSSPHVCTTSALQYPGGGAHVAGTIFSK